MEVAHEGSNDSYFQTHALQGVGKHFSDPYVPHTRFEVGNQQGFRSGIHPHMSHGT